MTLNTQRLLVHKGLEILDGGVNVPATERYENGLMAISLSLHLNNFSHLFNMHSGQDNNTLNSAVIQLYALVSILRFLHTRMHV